MSVIFEQLTKKICRITFNRPQKRNAINIEAFKQFRQSIERFENDKNLHFAVISGNGGTFCAGYDLTEIVDLNSHRANVDNIEKLLLPVGARLTEKQSKFCVAAINGYAAGFGFELALRCDFRVVEHNSRLGFLNRRFGIPILNGGSVILPSLVGTANAVDIIGTGKAIFGPEALQANIAHYIADVGCSVGRAMNFVNSLAKFDVECLQNDLTYAQTSLSQSKQMKTALNAERHSGLEFLKHKQSLDVAAQFVEGKLCRHGKFDLGNMEQIDVKVTL